MVLVPLTVRLPPIVISPANALLILASARASVKYKLVPSLRSLVDLEVNAVLNLLCV